MATVQDAKEIGKTLETLHQEQKALEILDAEYSLGTTVISHLACALGELTLTPLSGQADRQVRAMKHIQLLGVTEQGLEVHIPKLTLLSTSDDGYLADFPEQLDCQQSRTAYRAEVSHLKKEIDLRVTLAVHEADSVRVHAVSATLLDISTGGIKLALPDADKVDIKEAHIMHGTLMCRLPMLDDGPPIRLGFEVTSRQHQQSKKSWHLGCRFIDVSPRVNERIARFISRVQLSRLGGSKQAAG